MVRGMNIANRGHIKSSARELAIFGGQPAFTDPLHVGRPSIGNRENFLKLAAEVLDSGWLTNDGPLVRRFEAAIADHIGVRNCVAMCNGTIALEATIRALGLTGEVIVPSFTFVATAHALHWQGITPVFADIDPETHTLDPKAVSAAITPRTTGIIGVHLWGRAAEVEMLQQIADEHGLHLMFDAAHAFGCSRNGQLIGKFGKAEVLSFHATKFFNTFEGGAVLTDDDELASALRLMRNFGFSGYDSVVHPGVNGKMIEICAAMGLTNLDHVGDVIARNRTNYHHYQRSLAGIPGFDLVKYDESEQNNFQYVVIRVGDESPLGRDELIKTLHAENVLARRYFWPGCHRLSPYRELFPRIGTFLPQTELLSDRVLVLPTGAAVSTEDIDAITAIMRLRLGQ